MTSRVLKRVLRRETHSPRTAAAVIVIVLVAAAAGYAAVEIVLGLLGVRPLLLAPGPALAWSVEVPQAGPQPAVVAGGAAVALIGVVLIWLALSPGRLPRHRLGVSSDAIVVDNGVIASAVAERVRRELDLPEGGVVVGVGHRSADVTVKPEPGQIVVKTTVRELAGAELARYRLSPNVRVRARVLRHDGAGAP